MARKNTLQGNTPEQLKGKTIGVEQGSAQETYVNQHWRPQGINIVAYQGADSVVRDLESGRIDGAVLSGMMADYSFLQQPQGKEFAFVGGHLQDDTLFGAGAAIGLRKDDEALRQEINGAIAKILAVRVYLRAWSARRKIPFLIIQSTSSPDPCGYLREAEYKLRSTRHDDTSFGQNRIFHRPISLWRQRLWLDHR